MKPIKIKYSEAKKTKQETWTHLAPRKNDACVCDLGWNSFVSMLFYIHWIQAKMNYNQGWSSKLLVISLKMPDCQTALSRGNIHSVSNGYIIMRMIILKTALRSLVQLPDCACFTDKQLHILLQIPEFTYFQLLLIWVPHGNF
jgi:hypothetical protein